jgi:hypothetical protein
MLLIIAARLNGTLRKVLGRGNPLLTAARHCWQRRKLEQFSAGSNPSRNRNPWATNIELIRFRGNPRSK